MSDPLSRSDLDEMLERWVAEGWLAAGQAERIRAGEAARAAGGAAGPASRVAGPVGAAAESAAPAGASATAGAPAPEGVPAGAADPAAVPRRGPLIAEALGYVGGVLAVVGGFNGESDLWPGNRRRDQL